MLNALKILLLLVLAGCASAPPERMAGACGGGEGSYACQVHRYSWASGPP
jgi:hypothetical protein